MLGQQHRNHPWSWHFFETLPLRIYLSWLVYIIIGFPLNPMNSQYIPIPVVPHKAVAEVSKIGNL